MSAKKRISKMVDSFLKAIKSAIDCFLFAKSQPLRGPKNPKISCTLCESFKVAALLKRGGIPFEYQNRVLLMTKMDHLIQNNDEGLTLETSAFKLSTLANLVLSTQLMMLNHPVIPSHRRSTTVSLETYRLYSLE